MFIILKEKRYNYKQEEEIMNKLAYLIILGFLITGCKTAPKKEVSKITYQDVNRELSDRPLPSFPSAEKQPVTSHIDDKRYKGEDQED